ncbi:MAG: DNA replication/repair protein RecF [bacterium]
MRIKKLKLNNFRNFAEGEVAIGEGTTVFYGGVGEGKTNLIEAIFLLSVGKSYRASESHQVISWGKNEAYVRGEGTGRAGDMAVAIKVTKTGKKIELNGENNKRSIDLMGGLRSVLFHSEDTEIVSGGPQARRRYLDIAISQSSKNYAYNLREYYRILKQRNSALLKYAGADMTAWDDQLVKTGAWITQVRENVISEIAQVADQIIKSLAGENQKLEIRYVPSGETDPEAFKFRLSKAIDIDVARGTTTVGPHRDDFKLLLSGVDARYFASSGEKKTIVLALKLAEVEFIREVTGEKPALLLDDVFSTLDTKRSRALISATGDGSQCIITLTDLDILKDEFRSGAKLYEIKEGKVKQAL